MRFNESWLIFFEGGGWCWSPEDCAMRAESASGSSLQWPKNGSISIGGLVNKCCFCTKFCRFRRVFLKSCDGHSFAGNATIASPARQSAGKQHPRILRSAGKAIVRAVIAELVAHYGLADAVSVLVSGCSAGGLAALLNAERMRAQLQAIGMRRMRRFKVASLAGIFFSPPRESSSGAPFPSLSPFEEQMRAAVQLGRVSLPNRCTMALQPSEHWRCMMGLAPVEALPADLPAYIYQSRLDLWQTNCILTAGRSRYFALNCSYTPEWRRCLGWMQPLRWSSRCSDGQWTALRAYEEANDAALAHSTALRRDGYASFIHSCYDHCPSPYALINTGASLRPGTLNDSINVRESIQLWFLDQAHPETPAWNHTHKGCWNGIVAAKASKAPVPSCRRPECGQPDKMHHDVSGATRNFIKRQGWPFGWAP
jgi:hypothetical protein